MNMSRNIDTAIDHASPSQALPTAKPDGRPTFHRRRGNSIESREVSYVNKNTGRWERRKANEIELDSVANATPDDLLTIERWGRILTGAAQQGQPVRRTLRRTYEKRQKMDGETQEQADVMDALHDFHVVSGALMKAFHAYFQKGREPEAA